MGAWPTTGITGLGPTLDVPGLLTPGVADLAKAIEAIDGTRAECPLGIRMLIWFGVELADVDEPMRTALNHTARLLAAEGAATEILGSQVAVAELAATHAMVMAYEATRALRAERQHPESLSAPLNDLRPPADR